MSFLTQVSALTGLTISSADTNPTESQLTQFLKDGVIDVTNKIVALNPREAGNYTRVTSELTSNGHNLGSATILDVVRETGTVNDWRSAREIPPGLQSRVTDQTSLHYASKYNPAFIKWDDSSVVVYPAPAASPNRYKIFYINNVPTFTGGSGGVYDSTGISYFPNDKVYLVVIYASIQALFNKLSSIEKPVDSPVTNNTDISTIDNYINDEEEELATLSTNKLSAFMNAYQSEIAGDKTEYEWLQYRHNFLTQIYNAAFGVLAPPQQQQAQQQPQA